MEVLLKFFKDDANGEWGLAHVDAIDKGFNAFFSSVGIFHDIMEHYFEGEHKYFRGDYAYNVGGEIAASGHMTWYLMQHGLMERLTDLNPNSIWSTVANTVASTHGMIEDTVIYTGYCEFGSKLLSKVPHQRTNFHSSGYWRPIHEVIGEHQYAIDELMEEPLQVEDKIDIERSKQYRKSITKSKVANLYLWGYKQAAKLVPDTSENTVMLRKLYEELKRFTKNNSAEKLANIFDYLKAEITPGTNFKYKLSLVDNEHRKDWNIHSWEEDMMDAYMTDFYEE